MKKKIQNLKHKVFYKYISIIENFNKLNLTRIIIIVLLSFLIKYSYITFLGLNLNIYSHFMLIFLSCVLNAMFITTLYNEYKKKQKRKKMLRFFFYNYYTFIYLK